jgi:hypothetical protein
VLLQALLSIAFITLLAGALLTSALVNVKVASHEATARLTTAALARGTDEFVNWAQRYVSKYGASAAWPTSTNTDEPTPACPSNTQNAEPACTWFVTVAYEVTGSSEGSTSGPDPATNLQSALNENRISGAVTVTITNFKGDIVGSRTRIVTLRIFEASPFAVLTGSRETTAIAGAVNAEQGDSAGYNNAVEALSHATPDPANPSLVKNTSIAVTMSCANSAANNSNVRPLLDNKAPGNDNKPWGASGGSGFEAPCAPAYPFSAVPVIPADAMPQNDNVYNISIYKGAMWADNAKSPYAWPR